MKNLLLLGCLLIGMATTMSFTSPVPVNFDEATIDARAQGSIAWNISGGLANIVVNGGILVSGVSGTGSISFKDIDGITIDAQACPGYIVVTSNVTQNGNVITITATVQPV